MQLLGKTAGQAVRKKERERERIRREAETGGVEQSIRVSCVRERTSAVRIRGQI